MTVVHKSKTGVITIFEVFLWTGRVGRGYLVWCDGITHQPVLSSDDGKKLPEEFYGLVATEQRIVVVSETKQ